MQDTTIRLKVDGSPAINPLKQVTKETKKLENAVRNTNGQLKNAKGRFCTKLQQIKKAYSFLQEKLGNVYHLVDYKMPCPSKQNKWWVLIFRPPTYLNTYLFIIYLAHYFRRGFYL